MKVVTAAAALDSGEFTPDTDAERPDAASRSTASRSPTPAARPSATSTWTSPSPHSVNTYFAQVGEQLGTETMFEYMDRFGFFKDPELDYPDNQMAPSGVYNERQAARARGTRSTSAASRSARNGCLTTPMQMAEVAATVANDGKLMKPTFLQSAKDPDGRTTDELDPSRAVRRDLLRHGEPADRHDDPRHRGGHGGWADGRRRVAFAGKTGTAEIDVEQRRSTGPGSSGSRLRRTRRSPSR